MQREDTFNHGINHEEIEALQSELLVYLSDDIDRLSKLKKTEIVENKIKSLDKHKKKVMNTQSIVDLVLLANEILADPDITQRRFSGSGLTTVEENILGFLLTIYDKFSVIKTSDKDEVGWRGIQSFTDQIQITKVLHGYIQQYGKNFPGHVLPKFNDQLMVISQDNVAVMFDMEGVLASSNKTVRRENAAISKVIIFRIIDAFAYLLAQNIDPGKMPDKLRLCIGVNHSQRHWTALTVDIEEFFELYKLMYSNKKLVADYDENINYKNDQALAGRQRNIILNTLGLNHEPASEELMLALSGKLNISMNHYDSMNGTSCYNEILDSTYKLMETLGAKLNKQLCSQQKGNTCGEHTACNLIGIGLYDILPVINQEAFSTTTSYTLRTFTNLINDSDANLNFDIENDILQEAILKQMKNKVTINDNAYLDNPVAEKLMHLINLYSDRIYHLAPEKVTELLYAIQAVKGLSTSEIENLLGEQLKSFKPITLSLHGSLKETRYNELEDRIFTLAGILHNTNNKSKQFLFKQLGIHDEDVIAYCEISKLFINEKQSEIEFRILMKEYPVDQQEIMIGRYNKK